MRLGFPVRVYGCAGLPSHDGRPAHANPSLSLSLAYLRDVLYYLHANRIHMYRMHTELLPASQQVDPVAARNEVQACAGELALIGQLTREWDVRLSFHAGVAVTLSAPDAALVERSLDTLDSLAALMDAMALGPDGLIVTHVGGTYDDPDRARDRFARRYQGLPEVVRRRLVLENDDRRFCLGDCLAIHAATGIPVVLDVQHHLVLNPQRMPLRPALERALATWPQEVTPKTHFSTPRAEMRSLDPARLKAPIWTEHADYVNPFEFAAFWALGEGLRDFDVMLEAKARDLALVKVRQDLAHYAPEVAAAVF